MIAHGYASIVNHDAPLPHLSKDTFLPCYLSMSLHDLSHELMQCFDGNVRSRCNDFLCANARVVDHNCKSINARLIPISAVVMSLASIPSWVTARILPSPMCPISTPCSRAFSRNCIVCASFNGSCWALRTEKISIFVTTRSTLMSTWG